MSRNIADTLFSGETQENDVIGSDSLRFTTAAGYAAAVTAVVGTLLPVLDTVNALNVSENLKIAMIGLVAAGVVAYAVASAGDVLARAYATAHVHPAAGNGSAAKPPRPATEYIAEKILDALTEAAPTAKAELRGIATALSSARAGTIFPMSVGVPGKHKQTHDCKIYGIRQDLADKTKLQYLIARVGETPIWENADDVEVA